MLFFRKNKKFQFDPNTCPYCGEKITSEQQKCKKCGNFVNNWEACGKDRCGNCHEELRAKEKYCRYCGTKVGDGKFEPFQNIMECIYGPQPVERTHVCSKCGYTWNTIAMIDREGYCPQCGSPAPYEENEKP